MDVDRRRGAWAAVRRVLAVFSGLAWLSARGDGRGSRSPSTHTEKPGCTSPQETPASQSRALGPPPDFVAAGRGPVRSA